MSAGKKRIHISNQFETIWKLFFSCNYQSTCIRSIELQICNQ